MRERGVDRLEHRVQPLRPEFGLGDAKRNAGLPDLRLGARKPLAHRGGRNKKGRGDGGGVEAEHGLQHQRRANGCVYAGMGAGEHQRQPPIREARPRFILRPSEQPARRLRRSCGVARRRRVSAAPRRRASPPGFRAAAGGPAGEGGGEGVGQRILGRRDIAVARGEKGDELAVAFARHARRRRRARLSFLSPSLHRPDRPHFHRAVPARPGNAPPSRSPHRGRALRSRSSRRVVLSPRRRGRSAPATCRPRWRTIVALAAGCRRSPLFSTPASRIAWV